MGAYVSPPPRAALPSPGFWRGRRVLLTGHTGFKGSWLACWLRELGADLLGVSLPELPTVPSLWDQLGLDEIREIRADITSDDWMGAVKAFSPEVVLHLAAQSLVPLGHEQPALTFDVNVRGTVQVMSLATQLDDLIATLVITTDKVYDPRQQVPHSEGHYLGGADPYSASKAAAEMVVHAWPRTSAPRATARAGNVIGGGDWAANRLLPDLVRAWDSGTPVTLRRPHAIRPWQHVLEPLRGYLIYVEALASGRAVPSALNFGPSEGQSVAVAELARFAAGEWQRVRGALPETSWTESIGSQFSETIELTLDSRLAEEHLGWASALDWREAVTLTVECYHALLSGTPAHDLLAAQLKSYSVLISEIS